jgi:glycosyltransferase involved in cell wall biosynthesis
VTLVEAVALLRDRGRTVHLTFAADGSLSASLTRRIADLGLDSRIELRGGYRPEELKGLMAASDLYVSASLRDGTSVSLLEALAGGLYPVVSDIPANRPWISCGSDGQLFRPGDPHDLAGAVERALEVADRAVVLRCNRQRVATEGDRGTGFSALEARFAQLVEATASA